MKAFISWINTFALGLGGAGLFVIAALDSADHLGVLLKPVSFTPERPGDGKHPGVELPGIRLHVVEAGPPDGP